MTANIRISKDGELIDILISIYTESIGDLIYCHIPRFDISFSAPSIERAGEILPKMIRSYLQYLLQYKGTEGLDSFLNSFNAGQEHNVMDNISIRQDAGAAELFLS